MIIGIMECSYKFLVLKLQTFSHVVNVSKKANSVLVGTEAMSLMVIRWFELFFEILVLQILPFKYELR